MSAEGRLRIALCQLDPLVGDLEGNTGLLKDAILEAERARADLAVFPELVLSGYPPEDLALMPGFVELCQEKAVEAAQATAKTCALFGFLEPAGEDAAQALFGELAVGSAHVIRPISYNALAVAAGGELLGTYRKTFLPNYSVFDERRIFLPGPGRPVLVMVGGIECGLAICEDAWGPNTVLDSAAQAGAALFVVSNASPFYKGRIHERMEAMRQKARSFNVPLIYVNLVGGQDELVFDGGSFVLNADGEPIFVAPQFKTGVFVLDVEVQRDQAQRSSLKDCDRISVSIRARTDASAFPEPQSYEITGPEEQLYEALKLGTRDYVEKNGFKGALVGLSGGIDSSLVLCIASDALGPERVEAVAMPSRFSSEASLEDARELATALGVELTVIPIEPAHRAFEQMLFTVLPEGADPVVFENLQARIRGVLLMSLSNATGKVVLTTSNKSESAVGYATLYGDTAGGFAVIKDLYKTEVYRLARYRNGLSPVIPERVFKKPPSAELRPNQTDQDSLPPYEQLDEVLKRYIEGNSVAAEIIKEGFPKELVKSVIWRVDAAEYKRRQSPPGIRVSPRSFGKDRRMPITNGFRVGGSQRV